MANQGTLFVISAPSGAGKRTILKAVFAQDEDLEYAVSATTRPPRAGEVDGKDYVFLEKAEFQRRVDAGQFVEWAEVHGHQYGTLREELVRRCRSGKDVVLELDIQGMRALKALRDDVVTVFVKPPSLEALDARIRTRGADDEASIAVRLDNARAEMAAQGEYDHVIVNDVVDTAVKDLRAIVRTHRAGRHGPGKGVQEHE